MRLLDVNEVRALLGQGNRRCHLVGAAGSGMSGLAKILLERGHAVSGSDLKRSAVTDRLMELKFHQGHRAEQAEGAELLVFSSAVSESNPERAFACEHNIPQARRAEALAAICQDKRVLLMAGTHGKSSSTGMLAHVLRQAGRKPSYYIGADSALLGSSAGWDAGEDIAVESDESDGSMMVFDPAWVLLLNIEAEHMDYFRSVEDLLAMFRKLAGKASEGVVYCMDDELTRRVMETAECRSVSYGFHSSAAYRIGKVKAHQTGSTFEFFKNGQKLGTVKLNVPGRHQVSNACGVLALSDQLGVDFEVAAKAMETFENVGRRFEVLFETKEWMVVDDYAHHPTEIRATLESAKSRGRKRVVAVFQPHRFTRTRQLADEFARSFGDADEIFLTDIYPSSEEPIPGITGEWLAEKFPKQKTTFASTLAELRVKLAETLRAGDLVLVMGAGDVTEVAHDLAGALELRGRIAKLAGKKSVCKIFEPMWKHTTLRVGGPAQVWFEPASEDALVKVWRDCREQDVPVTVIGRGSNVLVRDGGIRGVCVHLSAFNSIRVDKTGITADAGALLRKVVMEAKRAGLGGLEFLEGIPATVGGALRMNAGAMNAWIFDAVDWVRFLDAESKVHQVPGSQLETGYRNVPALKDAVVLSARFKTVNLPDEEIQERLRVFAEKRRASQPAEPSAGCAFKNPEGASVGRWVEELGLKGTRCGGAEISTVHGNFIVNHGSAKAADVLELMNRIRETVRRERGVELEPEVQIIGENK